MVDLSFHKYDNCYALPIRYFNTEEGLNYHGGGLCCNDIWIKESALFPSSLASYQFDTNTVEFIDEDAVFGGCMSPVWGHALTDCLKHLWWFNTKEYKKTYKNHKIYYWGPKPLSGVYLELVRLAGIDITKLRYIDHEMRFRSMIVPDISFNYTEGWARKEYLDTIDLIAYNAKPYTTKFDKIFLSERESPRTWGIKSLEKLAISAGYKVYYPGEHSLQEQISVLRSANTILSFESSVGHNTIFCSSQTKLIMLRKENYKNKYQSIINELRGFDVTTVNASLSLMNDERFPYAGPFFVYPNDAVCQAVIPDYQVCSNKYAHLFPWKIFKRYIRYNLYRSEQTMAHVFAIPEAKAERLSLEMSKYRCWQFKRIRSFFKLIPLPIGIKEKAIRKIVKYKVRHVI